MLILKRGEWIFLTREWCPTPILPLHHFKNNIKPDVLILKSYFEEEQGKAIFLYPPYTLHSSKTLLSQGFPPVFYLCVSWHISHRPQVDAASIWASAMWLEWLRILFTFCEISMGLVADSYVDHVPLEKKKSSKHSWITFQRSYLALTINLTS